MPKLKEKKKMKMMGKRIALLLLLVAFIAPMGFNEPAFAINKLNVKKLFDTLERIPPAWSQKLPASQRFQLALDGEAVLDRETGLAWERSPSITTMDWYGAIYHCYHQNVGGRGGWRLPTVEELRSLFDPTQSNPALPRDIPLPMCSRIGTGRLLPVPNLRVPYGACTSTVAM